MQRERERSPLKRGFLDHGDSDDDVEVIHQNDEVDDDANEDDIATFNENSGGKN